MQRFFLAHSVGSDWRTLCDDCCDQLSGFPKTANLGFLYVTTGLAPQLKEILARDPKRIAGYIFAGLPVRGDNDYLVRNLLGLDLHSRRIAIGDRVQPGQEILFCSRDGNSARDDLRRMVRDIRRHLPASAKGGVYYSCLARGRYMFGKDSQELRLIRAELGDIPLVGFFANGEISHNRLYGYTGVLALFS